MATLPKLSLTDFDSNENILLYEKFLKNEIAWLFNEPYPPEVLFIPHAYNGNFYNTYVQRVRGIFRDLGMNVTLITAGDPVQLIRSAYGIIVGGGDLSRLLTGIAGYLDVLKEKIQSGTPYLGWNEGSVAASPYYVVPSIIPVSPRCIGAIGKQIYCHYVDTTENRIEIENFLINHAGDTPPVTEVVCTKVTPGGSGIRLEDDGSTLLDSCILGTVPPLRFIYSKGVMQVQ